MGGARAVVEVEDELIVGTINNMLAKGSFEDEFEPITQVQPLIEILMAAI